jgi:hypothetical protein
MSTPIKLSYSSMKTLMSCQEKYSHYKVRNTPHDPDYEESDALGIGKAFHKVLEDNKHKKYTKSEVIRACEEFNVINDAPMVEAMVAKYVEYHLLSGLDIVICELPLIAHDFTGFIDAIGVDRHSLEWWLIDLKTSARFDESLLPRLAKDPQLNLYAKFADSIESLSEPLQGFTFAGCRYRVATKTKSISTNIDKLKDAIKVYDVVIYKEDLDVETAWSIFKEQHDIAEQLFQGVSPKRNYGSCLEYFKPCQYFSQCHGHTFTEGKKKSTVLTAEILNQRSLL